MYDTRSKVVLNHENVCGSSQELPHVPVSFPTRGGTVVLSNRGVYCAIQVRSRYRPRRMYHGCAPSVGIQQEYHLKGLETAVVF